MDLFASFLVCISSSSVEPTEPFSRQSILFCLGRLHKLSNVVEVWGHFSNFQNRLKLCSMLKSGGMPQDAIDDLSEEEFVSIFGCINGGCLKAREKLSHCVETIRTRYFDFDFDVAVVLRFVLFAAQNNRRQVLSP